MTRLGDLAGAGEQVSESYRQIRRHFSSGDDPEDFVEPHSIKSQAQPPTPMTKAEINRSPLVVNTVKLSRREVRQISVLELSTRRSSIGSIVADSIELAQKSTDFK